MNGQRIISCIGLCKRAGKLIIGTPAICDNLAYGDFGNAKKIYAVFEGADTSDNTHKRLCDKCAFYKTELFRLPVGCEELASAVGKTGAVAAVAVLDKGMCEMVKKTLLSEEAR